MNEQRIREVIEVEKRALDLVNKANREAEQIPVDAQTQATAIVDSARAAAQDEAKRMIERARDGAEATGVISQSEDKIARIAVLAEKNLERAVEYVLERVLARA